MKLKGISPLIATILLVVVAVVLVTVVLTWGKNFTNDSLDNVTSLTDDSCLDAIGVLSLSNCNIENDGNITFRLHNNSNSYEFSSSDIFTIDLIGSDSASTDSYTMESAEVDRPTSWSGLAAGETIVVEVDPTNTAAATQVDLTVKSASCPSDAYAMISCR